jgi:hypothetical protein
VEPFVSRSTKTIFALKAVMISAFSLQFNLSTYAPGVRLSSLGKGMIPLSACHPWPWSGKADTSFEINDCCW